MLNMFLPLVNLEDWLYLTQLQTWNISLCIDIEVSFLLKLFVTLSQL